MIELYLTGADNAVERATYSSRDGEAWAVIPYDKLTRIDGGLPLSLQEVHEPVPPRVA